MLPTIGKSSVRLKNSAKVATAEKMVILAHWEANVYKDQWFTKPLSPLRRATPFPKLITE